MSRVGKQPIDIPDGVTVASGDGQVTVKGPKGELVQHVPSQMVISVDDGKVIVTRPSDSPKQRAQHGLTRALIANMVEGVTGGFKKSLELRGTGYRAQLQGSKLVLTVGYSHLVEMDALPGVSFECETQTVVHVSGIDKQAVGQQAALIRRVRPPEPYHGKGIRYLGEQVRTKAGKAKV